MIENQEGRTPLAEQPVQVPAPAPELVRLDLGCGQNVKRGFKGVDIADVDISYPRVDLFQFPWMQFTDGILFEDNSVDEIHSAHFFEHIPAEKRFGFLDEMYRVLKPGSRAQIICPYYNSSRASQDPTHCWPPISEASFLYANKHWRDSNKLSHYQISCDFDYVFGYTFFPDWQTRSEEAKAWAIKHYTNVVADIHVSLVKR